VIDQVELAMAYGCKVSQSQLLQYIHFNRHHNTLLVQHNTKLTSELRTDNALLIQENTRMIDQIRSENTLLIQENTKKIDNLNTDNTLLIQENTKKIDKLKADNTLLIQENTRKIEKMKSDNTPLIQNINDQISQLRTDVDDIKNDQISQLREDVNNIKAEQSSFPKLIGQLRKEMLSFDLHPPVAMVVRKQASNPHNYFDKTFEEYKRGFSANGESWIGLDELHRLISQRPYSLKITMTDYDGTSYVAVYDQFKVGAGDDFVLTVTGFNATLSTLRDSMLYHNGQKFSTKDRDQDGSSKMHCAAGLTGGWWYKDCYFAHPTGLSSATKKNGEQYVTYYHGGERGYSLDSWSEAEYLLVPN